MVLAVVHRWGRVDHAAAAVVGYLPDYGHVLFGAIWGPFQTLDEYPAGVVENVRREPEGELGRINDDADAVGERVAGCRRR